ncbi:MAG: molybdopterin-guanine dinucleotide biosynthesis protein B [Thermodesulfobacteriota bacterium]|nr:molybdopterin-guanine dinucleotide biosynthesis protein B [Thermodesulfobacteriota bacterium]
MIPIVSVVGKSNSGKTTLIEKMIEKLVERGYRVATIKHNLHGFDIDHEGKDSWRHKKAGARLSLLASPGKVAVIEDTGADLGIGELRDRYINNVDIILTEGFKGNPYPKIEVFRSVMEGELLSSKDDNLIAVASDSSIETDANLFDINDIEGIVDLVEDLFLS